MVMSQKIGIIDEGTVQDQTTKPVPIMFRGRGSSGIRSYAGYPSEEYLHQLRGTKRADVFDKMRRSDSKIRKVLKAVKDPIKAAAWEVQAQDGATPEQKGHAEFISHVLLNDLDPVSSLKQYITEALTALEFGFAPFEVIHKVVLNHKKFGSYIGLRKLAWRSPRTIERFNLDEDTEELVSITQQADGDLQRNVDIPAKNLALISLEREGSNFEGISALRYCYGAWLRKQMNLKILAIGLEKYAVPTPIGEVPTMAGPDYNAFIEALERYTSHETNYITLPKGWQITLKENNFDVEKVKSAIDLENMEIVDAFMTNFLELGMNGGGGAYALSNDLSDFFLSGLVGLAEIVAEPLNQKVIPDLVRVNFGPQDSYPQLVATGITDKAGQELASSIKALIDGRAIKPDDVLEASLRKRFGLPPADPATSREVPYAGMQSSVPSMIASSALSEAAIQLAERDAKKLISAGADDLKEVMRAGLAKMGKQLVQRLVRAWGDLSPDTRVTVAKSVSITGQAEYKQVLKDAMLRIAAAGVESARRDVPRAKDVKFSEAPGICLKEYDWLPPKLLRRIDTQAELLAGAQAGDLEMAMLFQYTSSAPSTDSQRTIEDDLNQALDDALSGPSISTGAGTTAAAVTNIARSAFFMEPEVLDQIEAFQFVNYDPISPICEDLAGRIFAKDDPGLDRYTPPLHHNCKSIMLPILKGNLGNREIEKLVPSRASLEKFITLREEKKSA
jgi:phage gp29-like protein